MFRLTPKANPAGSGPITTQFVAPKSDRGNAGNSGGPKIVEFVPPKSERGNSGSGVTTAKIVVPKAPRGDEPVLASAEQPAKPLLLAPASTSTETVADQGAPAPAASAIQAEAPSTGIVLPASSNEVALAYYRAAERYGYGSYSYASDDYGSDDDYSYDDQSYGYGSLV